MNKKIIWVISNIDFISNYPTEDAIHKGVWSLFGDHKSNRPYIFRVVQGKKITVVAIRSSINPEKNPTVGTIKVMEEIPLKEDTLYTLTVIANPIVEKVINGKGKRIPLIKQEDIEAWALKRLGDGGFTFCTSSNGKPIISCTPPVRKYMKEKGNFYFVTSNIQAVVKISDIDKANKTVMQGIGKEKAFGCGMINLVLADSSYLSSGFLNENNEEND
jgi:CRISPR-associated protein Cas6/Cse3/CasE subtype I-E